MIHQLLLISLPHKECPELRGYSQDTRRPWDFHTRRLAKIDCGRGTGVVQGCLGRGADMYVKGILMPRSTSSIS